MNIFPIKRKNDYVPAYLDPIGQLDHEIDHLFNWSFPTLFSPQDGLFNNQWAPAVDVVDHTDCLVVKAELPGIPKERIKVSVEDGFLKINGEKRHEENINKKGQFIRCERYYGKFQRIVKLPQSVDPTKAKANFIDGVLELNLPKKEEAKAKQIDIDVS